jgi:hypothetical protein
MGFYFYENTRANGHRAKVHRGECRHCNEGTGQRGGTRPDNGRWSHEFDTYLAALGAAQRTGAAVSDCHFCAPVT